LGAYHPLSTARDSVPKEEFSRIVLEIPLGSMLQAARNRVSNPATRKDLSARTWDVFWYQSKCPVLFEIMVPANQTKEGSRGRKPVSKKLFVRVQSMPSDRIFLQSFSPGVHREQGFQPTKITVAHHQGRQARISRLRFQVFTTFLDTNRRRRVGMHKNREREKIVEKLT